MAVRWWGGAGLGASFVFSELSPQLWPFGMLVGILETAPLLRTRSFLGRKVKRASRSWSLGSCFLHVCCVTASALWDLLIRGPEVYPSALLSLVLEESVLHPPWGVYCERGPDSLITWV